MVKTVEAWKDNVRRGEYAVEKLRQNVNTGFGRSNEESLYHLLDLPCVIDDPMDNVAYKPFGDIRFQGQRAEEVKKNAENFVDR
jgi:hypothetical protein